MGAAKPFEFFSRIRQQTDRTTLGAASWIDIEFEPDGIQYGAGPNTVRLTTESRFRGAARSFVSTRNNQQGSWSIRLYPNMTGTLMNGVMQLNGSSELDYFQHQEFVDNDLEGSAIDGISHEGVLISSFQVSADRDDEDGTFLPSFGVFKNAQDTIADGSIPGTFTKSPNAPYAAGDFLVDLVHNGTTSSFLGDTANLKTWDFNYDTGVTVKTHRPNATGKLDKTWTAQEHPNDPPVTFSATLEFDDSTLWNLGNSSSIVSGAVRVCASHPDAAASTFASAEAIIAGTGGNQTVDVAVGEGSLFAAGEVVLIQQAATGKFAFLPILSIATDTLTFATNTTTGQDFYVAIDEADGAVTIENMAQGWVIPQMDLSDPVQRSNDDNTTIVTLSYEVIRAQGVTDLVIPYFYNAT